MSRVSIQHEFVEFIPRFIEEGKLYISIGHTTAVHNCFCGCGNEVVTPLSPTDWSLIFNGETVSLYPSVGNWNFPCRSHYWVKRSKVKWARRWSQEEINAGRALDSFVKDQFYNEGRIRYEEEARKPKKSIREIMKSLFAGRKTKLKT